MATNYTTGLGLVQEQFIRATGRLDLDTDSPHDAIWFLNRGQRWLDSRMGFPKDISRYSLVLPATAFVVNVPDCRAIESVWISDGESRTRLEKQTFSWFRESFPALALLDGGLRPPVRTLADGTYEQPTLDAPSYCVAPNGVAPTQNRFLLETNARFNYDAEGVTFGESFNISTVLLAPPLASEATVTIFGYFASPVLLSPTDKSYWTETYPDLLVQAACYQLEVVMRNSQGARDWLAAIEVGLRGVDMDQALQESIDITRMEG